MAHASAFTTPPKPAPWIDWGAVIFGILAIVLGAASSFAIPLIPNPIYVLAIPFALMLVAATVTRLEWGLLMLIFLTYTRFSDVMVKYQHTPSVADPFIGLLLVVIAIRWFLYGERPKGWERAAAVVVIYGVVNIAGLLYAKYQNVTQSALIVFVKDTFVAIMAVSMFKQVSTLRGIVWTLLAAGMFLGTLTVWQQVGGSTSNNYWGFAQAAVQNIVGQSDDFRAAGSVGDPNFYAQIMVVLVPLALDRFWNEKHWFGRGVALYALAVTCLAIIFTYSRGGFVAMAFVAGLMLIRRPPSMPMLVFTAVAGLVLLQFAPPAYLARLQTIIDLIPGLSTQNAATEVSFRGRLSENTVALLMFQDHPLIGVGLDNYKMHYQDYSRKLGLDPRTEDRAPHSLYLQIASEFGLMGLAVFGVILFYLFSGITNAVAAFQRRGYLEAANLYVAFQTALFGYLFAGIFLHSAYARFMWLLLAVALTLPYVAQRELAADQPSIVD